MTDRQAFLPPHLQDVITSEDLADKSAEPLETILSPLQDGAPSTAIGRSSILLEENGKMSTSPLPSEDFISDKSKVDLLLKAVGDAPIMKKKRWAVEPSKTVAWVSQFVRKYLKCQSNESLFLYVNQYFSPSPDQEIGSLYECFGSDGKLVLHYCKQQAWG